MEYTKGEWKSRLTGNSRQVGDNYEIISPSGTGNSHYRIARVTNFNDAQLIASAPDMYETLTAVCGTLMALVNSKTIKGTTFGAGERIREIELVLAKAEGVNK